MMHDILRYCERQQDWLLDTIKTLVSIESPTGNKAAVDRCGRELQLRMESVGARVQRHAQTVAGDHLRAEFGSGEAQVLLLGHFDTVWDVGQLQAMPLVDKDGRLYGPGVFDMKAGIALGLLAARALFEAPRPPACRIVMLWTTDEETGSTTSRALLEEEARRSKAVLVLEPSLPGGALKTQRRGCGDFHLEVRGISAHAGIEPAKGASAIRELARQILALEELQDLERGVLVNVGIVSGGTRANVVPDQASAVVDVRVPTMADAARVEETIRGLRPSLARTSIHVTGGIDRPPLERTAAVVHLFETARHVAAELGRTLEEGATGGGSDGNFTAALGIPTLDGLGAVGDGAHALYEHVTVADLPWRAALIAGLIARIAEA